MYNFLFVDGSLYNLSIGVIVALSKELGNSPSVSVVQKTFRSIGINAPTFVGLLLVIDGN